MLFFRSEEAIDRWCAHSNVARGETLTIEQVWLLSQHWYGNRLSPDYHGRTATEVEAIFEQVGLTSQFWRMA